MARGEMKQRRSDELHSDHFPCNTPGCSEPRECVCETQERERGRAFRCARVGVWHTCACSRVCMLSRSKVRGNKCYSV